MVFPPALKAGFFFVFRRLSSWRILSQYRSICQLYQTIIVKFIVTPHIYFDTMIKNCYNFFIIIIKG